MTIWSMKPSMPRRSLAAGAGSAPTVAARRRSLVALERRRSRRGMRLPPHASPAPHTPAGALDTLDNGQHPDRGHRRPGRLRVGAAVRRSLVRPPHVRLLGGRRGREQGAPRVVAAPARRASGSQARPRTAARPWIPGALPTRSWRRHRSRRSAFNPFASGSSTGGRVEAFAAEPSGEQRSPVRPRGWRARPVRAPSPATPLPPAPPDRAARRGCAPQARAARPRPGPLRQLRAGCCSLEGRAVAYCQFGPLSAYPRALQLRDLYPQLPELAAARGHHLHRDHRRRAAPRARGRARRRRVSRAGASWFRGRRDIPGGTGGSRRDEHGPSGVLGACAGSRWSCPTNSTR